MEKNRAYTLLAVFAAMILIFLGSMAYLKITMPENTSVATEVNMTDDW